MCLPQLLEVVSFLFVLGLGFIFPKDHRFLLALVLILCLSSILSLVAVVWLSTVAAYFV